MWSSEPQIIELTKGERGLGFSILDYQVGFGVAAGWNNGNYIYNNIF